MRKKGIEKTVRGTVLKGVIHQDEDFYLRIIRKGKNNLKKITIIGAQGYANLNDKGEIIKKSNQFCYIRQKKYPFLHGDILELGISLNCQDLNEVAKKLATIIDKEFDYYISIILIGCYDYGLCFYKTLDYCERRIQLVTIETPFKGTVMADKREVRKSLLFHPKLYHFYETEYVHHRWIDKQIKEDADLLMSLKKPEKKHKQINFVIVIQENNISLLNRIKQMLNMPKNEKKIGDLMLVAFDHDGRVAEFSQKCPSANLQIYYNGIPFTKALKTALRYFKS